MEHRRRIGDGTMLGPGGRMVEPKSEGTEIGRVLSLIGDLRSKLLDGNAIQAESLLARIETTLERLHGQVSKGYHRNPYTPFRVVGVMGKDVHSVAYRHAKDGKLYKHDFKGGNARVLAVERHGKKELLITGDVPLWDEFD